MNLDFGFTNDSREYERVCAWRDAAIADGWHHEPTYPKSELEDRACRLSRDGWSVQILTRSRGNYIPDPQWPNRPSPHGKWAYEAQVSVWGPDGLAVNPGLTYDWNALKANLRHCPECGKDDVETRRVAFANRCCNDCAPKLKAELEKPGWCD
jgi:hypothetical protein